MDLEPKATLPSYAFRPSLWKATERVACLDRGALVVKDGESVQRIALDDIKSIRLFASQTGTDATYYCEIAPRIGAKLLLRSTSVVGRAKAENRAGAYRSFVTALVDRVAAANASTVFIIGPTPRVIWLMSVGALIAIVPILLLCIVVMLVDRSVTTNGLAFMALMVATLPIVWLIASRGPPHPFDAGRIDAAILPAAAPPGPA